MLLADISWWVATLLGHEVKRPTMKNTLPASVRQYGITCVNLGTQAKRFFSPYSSTQVTKNT